jgi:hypothetical protein
MSGSTGTCAAALTLYPAHSRRPPAPVSAAALVPPSAAPAAIAAGAPSGLHGIEMWLVCGFRKSSLTFGPVAALPLTFQMNSPQRASLS